MANKLTVEALMDNMRPRLQAFNNEGVEITNDTRHSQVLAYDDGFVNAASSAPMYLGAILWVLWAAGGKPVEFPKEWLSLTVQALAEYLISKQTT